MADKYLYSAGGGASAPYESTATAAADLNALIGGTTVAVSEKIWVHSSHVETFAVATTYTDPASATVAALQQLLCVSDWDASPGTLVTSPSAQFLTSTSSDTITLSGNWYVHGCIFYPGGTGGANIAFGDSLGPTNQVFNTCRVELPGTTASQLILGFTGGTAGEALTLSLLDFSYLPKHSSNLITFGNGTIQINNFSFHVTGATAPTTLFSLSTGATINAEISNSDLSGLSFTNLVSVANQVSGQIDFINCKLPSGINVTTGTWSAPGVTIRLMNCDSADTNYRFEKHQYQGVITTSNTIYATTTPALDETSGNSYSHVMAGNANTNPFVPLYSEWVERWVTAGTTITPYFEILVSGSAAAALKNSEVWAEFEYNSGATSTLGTRVTDGASQIIDAGVDQADGTTAWTGDGYATERTHKLAPGASFTPDKSGYIRGRVALAKNSTIYLDPQIRV